MRKKLLSALLVAGLLLAQPLTTFAQDAPVDENGVLNEEAILENETTERYHAMSSDVGTGTWKQDDNGWWFAVDGGEYPEDGVYTINGTDYVFDKNGYMVTGWYKKTYEDYNYAFNYDWYYCNPDGSMKTGWLYDGGSWYYLDPDYGYMYFMGAFDCNGTQYVFGQSGAMITGWSAYSYTYSQEYEGYSYSSNVSGWLYANSDGTAYTGWLWYNNNWYYIYDSGVMAKGTAYTGTDAEGNSLTYVFGQSGAMVNGGWTGLTYNYVENGVATTDTTWFYANSDGTGYNGWLWYNGSWYYISNGYMFDEISVIDGDNAYFLGKGGAMVTTPGWVSVTYPGSDYVNWYYVMDSSGKLATGTKTINGTKYHFYDDGLYIPE